MSNLKFELAFPYNIQIEPTVNGGVIVRVGCAQLTYENTNKMLKALKEYFSDPEAAEKAYNACNALRAGGGEVATAPPQPTLRGSGNIRVPDPEYTEESLGAAGRDPEPDQDSGGL